jgi:hypothetical protein
MNSPLTKTLSPILKLGGCKGDPKPRGALKASKGESKVLLDIIQTRIGIYKRGYYSPSKGESKEKKSKDPVRGHPMVCIPYFSFLPVSFLITSIPFYSPFLLHLGSIR